MKSGLKMSGLGLVTIFSGFTLAAIGLFLYYVIEIAKNPDFAAELEGKNPESLKLEGEKMISYRAAVLGFLFVLAGMHGYVVMRRLI